MESRLNKLININDVLVVTTRKSFWSSKESERFSNRVETIIFFGYSENYFNSAVTFIRTLIRLWVQRPKAVIVSQVARVAVWLSYAIRYRIVPKCKWIVIDPVYLHDRHAKHYDLILVYCREQIKQRSSQIRHKFQYIDLPANGDFTSVQVKRGDYFVSIGIAFRDFKTLIAAARVTKYPTIIVTKNRETLGDVGEIPENVKLYYSLPLQECVKLVAESRAVIVPLLKGEMPHGHSAVVQALRLGKAVISTKNATVDDYITNGKEGILVEPENATEYAEAMHRLWNEDVLLKKMENNAIQRSSDFSYECFADRLVKYL